MNLTRIGILQSGQGDAYSLVMDTSEAVIGSPVFQSNFDNVGYNIELTTTGTQSDTGTIRVSVGNDVTVNVTRTGAASDSVVVAFQLEGLTYAGGIYDTTVITGPPDNGVVNVTATYAYADLLPGYELKVLITEG